MATENKPRAKRTPGPRKPSKVWAVLYIDKDGKPAIAVVTRNVHELLEVMDSLTNANTPYTRQEVTLTQPKKKLQAVA